MKRKPVAALPAKLARPAATPQAASRLAKLPRPAATPQARPAALASRPRQEAMGKATAEEALGRKQTFEQKDMAATEEDFEAAMAQAMAASQQDDSAASKVSGAIRNDDRAGDSTVSQRLPGGHGDGQTQSRSSELVKRDGEQDTVRRRLRCKSSETQSKTQWADKELTASAETSAMPERNSAASAGGHVQGGRHSPELVKRDGEQDTVRRRLRCKSSETQSKTQWADKELLASAETSAVQERDAAVPAGGHVKGGSHSPEPVSCRTPKRGGSSRSRSPRKQSSPRQSESQVVVNEITAEEALLEKQLKRLLKKQQREEVRQERLAIKEKEELLEQRNPDSSAVAVASAKPIAGDGCKTCPEVPEVPSSSQVNIQDDLAKDAVAKAIAAEEALLEKQLKKLLKKQQREEEHQERPAVVIAKANAGDSSNVILEVPDSPEVLIENGSQSQKDVYNLAAAAVQQEALESWVLERILLLITEKPNVAERALASLVTEVMLQKAEASGKLMCSQIGLAMQEAAIRSMQAASPLSHRRYLANLYVASCFLNDSPLEDLNGGKDPPQGTLGMARFTSLELQKLHRYASVNLSVIMLSSSKLRTMSLAEMPGIVDRISIDTQVGGRVAKKGALLKPDSDSRHWTVSELACSVRCAAVHALGGADEWDLKSRTGGLCHGVNFKAADPDASTSLEFPLMCPVLKANGDADDDDIRGTFRAWQIMRLIFFNTRFLCLSRPRPLPQRSKRLTVDEANSMMTEACSNMEVILDRLHSVGTTVFDTWLEDALTLHTQQCRRQDGAELARQSVTRRDVRNAGDVD